MIHKRTNFFTFSGFKFQVSLTVLTEVKYGKYPLTFLVSVKDNYCCEIICSLLFFRFIQSFCTNFPFTKLDKTSSAIKNYDYKITQKYSQYFKI